MKPNFNLEDRLRKNIYSVPEAYFDKLPNRIMQRVTETPEAKSWFPAGLRMTLTGSGIAAAFAAVFIFNTNNTVSEPELFAGIQKADIIEYLVTNGQVEQADLALLNAAETDFTADFINVPKEVIRRELEDQPIEDLYL